MKRIILIFCLAFFVAFLITSAGSSSDREKKDEFHKLPSFPSESMLFPEPKPVPPPGGELSDNPMMLLAKPKTFAAARVSSYARNGGNLDTITVPASGEEVTIAEIKGPGAVTHIWNTFRGNGRDLIMRIYWEGSVHPSVEAPIGDLFGVAMGINAPMSSFPIQSTSEGRARNCWWYMPFNISARITVSNIRPEKTDINLYYYIDYQVYNQPIKEITYFHARFWETDPSERGKPVRLVEAEGNGHYVGVVMGHRSRTPGWFGEGDDIITVDGKVSFIGTGTEDYFCDAWGFRVFNDLYHGVPVYEGREIGNRLSAYRFHIVDPIPFRKSFRFEIEHWPWVSPWFNTGREYYSSQGFWYQKKMHSPWPRLDKIISHEPWDPAKGRWYIPGALEAENMGILEYKSRARESSPMAPQVIAPALSSGEVLRSVLRYSPRPAPLFIMPNFSGDCILTFDAGGEGGEFSLSIPVQESGVYTVKMHYVRAENYGAIQLYINGLPVGEVVDTFLKTEELTRPLWPPREYSFNDVPLKEGQNVFRFVVISKNPASEGFKVGVDCLVLEKEK